jgi:ComF family protein
MPSPLKHSFQTVWNTIFPSVCIVCQNLLTTSETHLCTECRLDLPTTDFHVHEQNVLWQKFAANLPISFALSYLHFAKHSKAQKLLHHLKYYEAQELGEMLGMWYGHTLQKHAFDQQIDLLLPVPLHASKLKKRGYNQSNCFAKGLSNTSTIPCTDTLLVRNKATETQTRKSRIQRWENVNNIFVVTQPEQIANKHIAIVDDVVTTGATTEACLQAIMKAGASHISVITLATAA